MNTTNADRLFEGFCQQAGIDRTRIPEANGVKTPDYKLVVDGQTIIAEVKEFTKNKEEKESDRLMEERGYGKVIHEVLGARVRKKIWKSSRQIKTRSLGCLPSLLVLYDHGQKFGHLHPRHIMTAMYGAMQIVVSVPRDFSIQPRFTDHRFGPGRKMTADANTSISAIGVLFGAKPGLDLGLDVYHNKYAAIPIEPELLERRGIPHYRIDREHMTWV